MCAGANSRVWIKERSGQSARARLPTERMDKAVKTDKRFILDADTDGCMRDNQIPAQSMA